MGDEITFGDVSSSTIAAGRGAMATSVTTGEARALADLQQALVALERKLERAPEAGEVDDALAAGAALQRVLREPNLDREKGRRRWQAFTTAVMTLASATTIAVNTDLARMTPFAQALGLL